VSWLLRFLAWATVLALPAYALGDAYHRMLAVAAMAVVGVAGDASRMSAPDIPASHALGVYAALCLASIRATWRRRLIALGLGLVVMIALEIATGALALRWALNAMGGAAAPPVLQRLRDHLTALPAWLGAPALWLAFLGRWELPGATPPPPAAVRARGPGGPASPRAA
jgi:hypothetical protein